MGEATKPWRTSYSSNNPVSYTHLPPQAWPVRQKNAFPCGRQGPGWVLPSDAGPSYFLWGYGSLDVYKRQERYRWFFITKKEWIKLIFNDGFQFNPFLIKMYLFQCHFIFWKISDFTGNRRSPDHDFSHDTQCSGFFSIRDVYKRQYKNFIRKRDSSRKYLAGP